MQPFCLPIRGHCQRNNIQIWLKASCVGENILAFPCLGCPLLLKVYLAKIFWLFSALYARQIRKESVVGENVLTFLYLGCTPCQKSKLCWRKYYGFSLLCMPTVPEKQVVLAKKYLITFRSYARHARKASCAGEIISHNLSFVCPPGQKSKLCWRKNIS